MIPLHFASFCFRENVLHKWCFLITAHDFQMYSICFWGIYCLLTSKMLVSSLPSLHLIKHGKHCNDINQYVAFQTITC